MQTKKHTLVRSKRMSVCFGFRVGVGESGVKGGELVGAALGL